MRDGQSSLGYESVHMIMNACLQYVSTYVLRMATFEEGWMDRDGWTDGRMDGRYVPTLCAKTLCA